jgi:LysM repeat protein
MISSKIAVSAAAIAAVAIGGQAAASAASAATASAAQHSARPAALTRAVLTADTAATYTVQPGDTLSGIGTRFGISWQALYAANTSVVGPNPNLIYAGEILALTSAASQQAAQSDQPVQSQQSQSAPVQSDQVQSDQTQSDQTQSNQTQSDQVQQPSASQSSGGAAPGSFQQCVIENESGGDAQVMNSSGHYGLYQFSQSTWDAAGGNPAEFGNASVAEQNQVFQNAYAQWGTSPWAPYDGC